MNYEKMTKAELIRKLKLQRSNELFQAITSSLHETAIVIYDKGGHILDLWGTPEMDKRYGLRAADAVGKSIRDIFPDRQAKQKLKRIHNVFKTGQKQIIEEVCTFPKGDFWHELAYSPLIDKGNNITAVVGFVRDVTKRKMAEESLKRNRNLLQLIMDNTTAVIYVKDRQGRYVLINSRFETLFNVTREDTIGKTDREIFPEENAEAFMANDRKVLDAGVPLELEEIAPHDDGPHTYISIKFPLLDSHGMPDMVCGISTDITGRKQAEEDIRMLKESLEQRVTKRTNKLRIKHSELKKEILERLRAENNLITHARQQAVVACLGHQALLCTDITTLMSETVRVVADVLDCEYGEILELLPDGKTLLMRAGAGWKNRLAGKATISAEDDSQAGYTLKSSEPVIVNDLKTETRFSIPPLLREHKIISGMSVVIHGRSGPWGMLGVHTVSCRSYSSDDSNFLQSVANLLADTTTRMETEKTLQEQKIALEQKNIALSEILGQIELEKKQIQNNVIANAENLLLPIIQKLKLKGESRRYVHLLQKNLEALTSSFGVRLSDKKTRLSAREIEICNMIKHNLASKEIATLLNVSLRTVEKHRINIRTKLGIVNKELNLSSYLQTL